MSGRLEGKVALVTGAASGIGATISKVFVEQGACIIAADVLDVGPTIENLGDRAAAALLDVTSEGDWSRVVAESVSTFGRLDILINNAGVAHPPRPLTEQSLQEHQRVIAVNVDGVFLGMRAVVEQMTAQGSGSIVNISSIDGLVGAVGMVSYVASKFAVTGMTRSVALELGPRGIRVNSIHPGVIATPLADSGPAETKSRIEAMLQRQPISRIGTPEEVAQLALFLGSDESSYSTGSQFSADGGSLAGPYRDF
jgi:3alpha(or 20beta)-hydroxysteroid dehydrogenase